MFHSFRELPPRCRAFVAAVSAIGLLLLIDAARRPLTAQWGELLYFMLLASTTSTWRVHLTARLGTLSVAFAVVFSALITFGLPEAVLVGGVSALAGTFRSSKTGRIQPGHRIVYGIGCITITAFVSGMLYRAADGRVGAPLAEIVLPVSVSTITYYFVNTFLVAIPAALSKQDPIFRTWKGLFLWTVPSYFAGTCSAVLMSLCYRNVGFASALLVTPPLYIVLYSYRLYVEKMEHELHHIRTLTEHGDQLKDLYLQTIYSLVAAIDAKDRYTRDHSSRVQQYAVMVAQEMQLDEDSVEAIRAGGLLHDVGKLGIPDHVLAKPTLLTGEEYNRVQQHPALGYEILRPLNFPWEVLPVVRSHHERFDGKGYPDGLHGEQIPLVARVLAVADVYDALTSARPHREAWSHREALEYIESAAGTQFDPQVVEGFLRTAEAIGALKRQSLSSSRPEPIAPPMTAAPTPVRGSTPELPAQVLNRISTAHQEMFALYEVAQIMGNAVDVDETCQLVLNKIQRAFGPCCAVVFLLDAESGELVARKAIGPQADAVWLSRLRVGEGITGQVVATGEPMVSDEAEIEFRSLTAQFRPSFQSVVAAPLTHRGQVLGALTCYHERPRLVPSEMASILPQFAAHAALAMHNAIRIESMRQTALIDGLTGLANDRHLHLALNQEIERAHRSQHPLSVLMFDLDSFKRVNEAYGPVAGDQVLREIASLLRSLVREYDLAARYGGDEFVLLLPNCNAEQARQLSDRVQRALAEYCWSPHPGQEVTIGASIGMATFPLDALKGEELLHLADERMTTARAEPAVPLTFCPN